MKQYILTAVAAIALGFSAIAQADETVSVKLGYMVLTPSGQFGATAAGPIAATNKIDMKNDLGFKKSQQPTGEVAFQLGDSRLSVGFVPLKFEGTGALNRNVTYNGQTYTAGTTVTSSLKADIFDVGYTYYLINMDDLPSRAQLGIEAAVKIVNAKTSLSGGGITSSKNATVPIPTIGLRGRIALADFIGVVGRVGYLGYSGNSFLDADAQIEFSPVPTLGIYAGYRQIKLKVDSSNVFVDTTFKGPYAGAFFRF
ncbi:MAG TPA: hypothetical protein VKA31_06150 [Mariprofundaceae bacterium]|nr:hypothetical protein [Mariprofundaceae bacterium]